MKLLYSRHDRLARSKLGIVDESCCDVLKWYAVLNQTHKTLDTTSIPTNTPASNTVSDHPLALLQSKLGQLVPLDRFPKSDLFQQPVRPVHIVIDDDDIVPAVYRVLDLGDGGVQTFLQGFLRLGPPSRQAGLEFGQRGRGEKEKDGVERRMVGFDELDALGIDIQDTSAGLIGNVLDGLDAGPVPVPRELSVLDEFPTVDHFDKGGVGGKVVVNPVDFTRAGRTGGMRDGKPKLGRVGGKEPVEQGGFTRSRGTTDDEGLRDRVE